MITNKHPHNTTSPNRLSGLVRLLITISVIGATSLNAALPELPSGLDILLDSSNTTDLSNDIAYDWRDGLPFELSGFWEARLGTRLQDDTNENRISISESRLHVDINSEVSIFTTALAFDAVYDPLMPESIDLEYGSGSFDLREASVFFSPTTFMDLKIGRQILTWGTGDLLFINDMFPKDWNSFFLGRDQEYLKAPSDSLKGSFFTPWVNIDVVYTPGFDADRFINGNRISFYNPSTGTIVGQNANLSISKRDKWFEDDEVAARVFRLIGSTELAAYYYNGYWKSPNGQQSTGDIFFPSLSVYGFSARSPIYNGVGYFEFGYYDSHDDISGSNPLVPNSQSRYLVGYEQELDTNLTGAVQYYLENMMDYANYVRTLPNGIAKQDELRHVITARLTKMLDKQTWILSLFAYYSPSDKDGYIRSNVTYKASDTIRVESGVNIFYGVHNYTFFGQFIQNNNVYGALRIGF